MVRIDTGMMSVGIAVVEEDSNEGRHFLSYKIEGQEE